MYLCITGFLPDSFEDSSLKYELDVDAAFNDQIVELLGHENLGAMASGEWPLTDEQVQQVGALIGETIPPDLNIFIGVED
jgi:hypothetical protein